jgi:hypothetical protein
MIKKANNTKKQEIFSKEGVAAAVMAAFAQHGIIQRKHPKQKFVKKESEWKKRRISGLR